MKPSDAVRRMVDRSGLSGYEVSRKAGRATAYVSVMLSRGVDPSTRVMADLAAACGYTLQLVGHGETLILDGTVRRGGQDSAQGGDGDAAPGPGREG